MMSLFLILALCEEEDARRVPRNRLTIPMCKAFDMTEENFINNFRLSKTLAFQLIEELKPFLEPKTIRKTAFNTEIKVLCALKYFAFGDYQKNVGNNFLIEVCQSSVSNYIREVSEVMSKNLLKKYVKFPDDQSAQKAIKDEFLQCCRLQEVLGTIDCTHVAIVAPPNDGYHHERNYVNVKGWHSINVQIVCDMNMRILNVVARFPGCSHDAHIWQTCNLKKAFDNGSKIHGDGWLLGDSAYPEENHLHTPFSTVSSGSPEERYNVAHSRGRSVIARCNGVLKNRFQCLLKQRTLRHIPETACRIINSCVILHNICVDGKMSWEDIDLPDEDALFNTVVE